MLILIINYGVFCYKQMYDKQQRIRYSYKLTEQNAFGSAVVN